jgi:hypothetical protein
MKRTVFTIALLLLLATGAYAAFTMQWLLHATTTTMLTPNALASNAFLNGTVVVDNTIGSTGNGYTYCRFEAVLNFGAAPAANAALLIWILESLDGGATYADAPTSSVTTTNPSLSMPLTTATTMRQILTVRCPPGFFKITAQLNGSGQTTTGTNTVKLRQFTMQGG